MPIAVVCEVCGASDTLKDDLAGQRPRVEPTTDRVIGEFNRKFTLFDKYVLDLSADRAHELDRRLGVALAILLDTGERR